MDTKKSVFETLNAVNCNEHIEKKNGLTYLSWAWAWQIAKGYYPLATYTIYENAEGWNYFTDGITAWVKTGVTIEGIEHIEYLPVMDFKNNSIPAGKVTSFDVNKTIQRSLTKALARHGLGLYIYAGEDLPDTDETQEQEVQKPKEKVVKTTPLKPRQTKPKQEVQQYTPCDEHTYWGLVACFCEGKLCPSGITCEERWKQLTHPTPEAIVKWGNDCLNYKVAHGIEV